MEKGKEFFSQAEPFAQVKPAHVCVGDEIGRPAAAEDFSVRHYIRTVGNSQRFADVMVGYQDTDALVFEVEYYLSDIVDSEGVDTSERLIEENVLRLGRQASGDLDAPPFAAGKCVAPRSADVDDAEFLEEFLEPFEAG